MNALHPKREIFIGIGLALITAIIWSGNYVVAKGISQKIPPISLAFFRWSTACLFIIPLGWKKFQAEKKIFTQHKTYLFLTALFGVGLFNTFIYLAGHYTSAINLALIGTTASPVFITTLSFFLLKEKIKSLRIIGMILCIAGILLLLSQGSFSKLMQLHFGKGDLLILCSAFFFSIYSILVKKKPATISPISFLFVIFIAGTIMLFPFAMIEMHLHAPLQWTSGMYLTILYLGIGNSVIGFLCWNGSIARIGAARTSLFGNLIPVFSTIEAVLLLGEQFTVIHFISGIIVIAGIVIANLK
jgi:drug/metabolite transporter (DMT)-like permease